ncbi:MAG: hypothetical protein ACI906_004533, partial [Candidatus Latescibacterota bacterium]
MQSTGRPVAELVKFIVGLPLGDDLRPFHLANILLHIGNALLLASLVMRLTRDAHLSSLTALLFALSPLHHQAIHHMSAMDYLLSGAFALGVIHALLSKRLGWALGLAALSILSHGASFAPLVLLALSTQHRYRYAAGLLWHIPPLLSFDNWELWTGFAVALAAVLAAWRYEGQTRYIILLTAAAIAPYGFMYTDITEGYSGGSARYRYVSAMGACWLFSMGARSLFKRLPVPPRMATTVLALVITIITYQASRQTYIGSTHSVARSQLSSKASLVGTQLMLKAIHSEHNRLLDVED